VRLREAINEVGRVREKRRRLGWEVEDRVGEIRKGRRGTWP